MAGCKTGCVSSKVVRIQVLPLSAHQRCELGHACEDEAAHSEGAGPGGGSRGRVGSRPRSWARDGPKEEAVMLEARSRVEWRTERRWRGLRWRGRVSVGGPFFFWGTARLGSRSGFVARDVVAGSSAGEQGVWDGEGAGNKEDEGREEEGGVGFDGRHD